MKPTADELKLIDSYRQLSRADRELIAKLIHRSAKPGKKSAALMLGELIAG